MTPPMIKLYRAVINVILQNKRMMGRVKDSAEISTQNKKSIQIEEKISRLEETD